MTRTAEESAELQRALRMVVGGTALRRVKHKSVGRSRLVQLSSDRKRLSYHSRKSWKCLSEDDKTVSVGEILEVRTGWRTDNFNKAAKQTSFCAKVQEQCSFSVVFRHPHIFQKSIDFVADNADTRKSWVLALNHLVSLQRKERVHFNEERWLTQQFTDSDVNNNGELNFDEIWKLLERLNLELSKDYCRALFEKSDVERSKSKFGEMALNKDEFLKFFRLLTERPEFDAVMLQYSSGNEDFLLPEDLQRFLEQEQGFGKIGLEKCEELIKKLEPNHPGNDTLLLGPEGFRRLLLSPWGSLFRESHGHVYQDMTQPLAHYFVNSSHNTYCNLDACVRVVGKAAACSYLTGGQLSGEASVEGYVNALKRGARLVELDVYNGEDGEPELYHGHTLVRPILLSDALRAIRDYAFTTTPYPVILSIENHCGVEQQRRMADHFVSIFGDKLYRRPHASLPVPSPDVLKGFFIVKAKMLPSDKCDCKEADVSEDEEGFSSAAEVEDADDEAVGDGAATASTSAAAQDGNVASGNSLAVRTDTHKRKKKKTKRALAKELSDVVGIPSVHLDSFAADVDEHVADAFVSVSESKMKRLLESDRDGCARYTSTRIVKCYPKGLRTDSSNMHPMGMWNAGVQVVAFNMQTSGEPLDLNEAKFRANGGAGYVLKPQSLRDGDYPSTLKRIGSKLQLTIAIISGQYLPKPDTASKSDIVDPYVSLEMFGLPIDCHKDKTSVIRNNGFNPVWNERFTFSVAAPDFAFLRLCVKDYDMTSTNDFIGQYTVPVSSIQPGLRTVPVFSHDQILIEGAYLYVHTQFDYSVNHTNGAW